uniref:CARD domain-containing protein n=1 Tax=Trichuris muris TaxID=70415 RepID=A0A5S6QM09_TRIMR
MLSENERCRLLRAQPLLLTDLEPKELIAYLQACSVLTDEDVELICSKGIRRERVVAFLEIYRRKARSLEPLIQALRKETLEHLVVQLMQPACETDRVGPSSSQMTLKMLCILGKVPRKPQVYVERTVLLEKIKHALFQLENEPGWVVVHGMGGCGKSVLASAVLADPEITGKLFDRVFWIVAGRHCDKDRTLATMQDLCTKMSKDAYQLSSISEATDRLVEVLLFDYPRTLIVLDDVWSDGVVQAYDELQCRILATTRNALLFDVVNNNKHFVLLEPSGFTREEAMQAFSAWLSVDPARLPREAEQIFHECKGHPFLISLVGSLLKEHKSRWKFYHRLIHTHNLNKIRKVSQYQFTTFNEAALLSFDDLSESSKKLYFDLAVFPLGVRISPDVLSVYWEMSTYEVEDILSEFAKRALLIHHDADGDDPTSDEAYYIHTLVHRVVKMNFGADERQKLHQRFLDGYLARAGGEWHNLPEHVYIHAFIGYHLFRSNNLEALADVYLNLGLLAKKISLCGPSTVLRDFALYGQYIRNAHPALFDQMQELLQRHSHQLAVNNGRHLNFIQRALLEPRDSELFKQAKRYVESRNDSASWRTCATYLSSRTAYKPPRYMLSCKSAKASIWLSDQKILVYLGYDSTLRVCCTTTGLPLYRCAMNHLLTSISFSRGEGKVLVSYNGCLAVFDVHVSLGSRLQLGSLSDEVESQRTPSPLLGCQSDAYVRQSDLHEDSLDNLVDPLLSMVEEIQICDADMTCCVVGRSGNVAACCTSDCCIRLCDLVTGKLMRQLLGHHSPVTKCRFDADDSRLVSADQSGVVILWQLGDCQLTRLPTLHFHSILFCDFVPSTLPQGCVLTISEKLLAVYNIGDGMSWKTWQPDSAAITCAGMSPSGRAVAVALSDCSIMILNMLDDGISESVLTMQYRPFIELHFSTCGADLLALRNDGAFLIFDNVEDAERSAPPIKLLDVVETNCGVLLASVDGFDVLSVQLVDSTHLMATAKVEENACHLQWSRNGLYICIAHNDGQVKLWTFENGQLIFFDQCIVDLAGLLCATFTPDSSKLLLASSHGQLRVMDLNGKLGHPFKISLAVHVNKVICFGEGQNQAALVACDDGAILRVIDCDVDDRCRWIASASDDLTVKVWDLERAQMLFEYYESATVPRCCKISPDYPDGNLLAVGDDRGVVCLICLSNGSRLHKIFAHVAPVHGLAFCQSYTLLTLSSEVKWYCLKTRQLRLFAEELTNRVFLYENHGICVLTDKYNSYHVMELPDWTATTSS